MSKFVKVNGKWTSYGDLEPIILNIDQIVYITPDITPNLHEYNVRLSSDSRVYLDAANAQKVFAQMGISL